MNEQRRQSVVGLAPRYLNDHMAWRPSVNIVGPGLRRCTVCREIKPTSAYSPHPRTRDGAMARCKRCLAEWVRLKRLSNLEDVRKRERERPHTAGEIAARRAYSKKYKARHPERHRIASRLRRLKKKGAIQPPAACESCGRLSADLEMHHEDYSKPMEVVFVCNPCHAALDDARAEREARIA